MQNRTQGRYRPIGSLVPPDPPLATQELRGRCPSNAGAAPGSSGLRNPNPELFTKQDFHVHMRSLTITCPAVQTEHFTPGATVEFEPEGCGRCWLRARRTMATASGRTVAVAEDERLQHRLWRARQ